MASPSFTASVAPIVATWQLVSSTPLSMTTPLPEPSSRPDASITFTRATLGATSAKTSSAERALATGGTAIAVLAGRASTGCGDASGNGAKVCAGDCGSDWIVRDITAGASTFGVGGASRRVVPHHVTPPSTTAATIHLPHASMNVGPSSIRASRSLRPTGAASDASYARRRFGSSRTSLACRNSPGMFASGHCVSDMAASRSYAARIASADAFGSTSRI